MKKIYCDRCGREIEVRYSLPIHVQIDNKAGDDRIGILIEKEFENKVANFDVCPICVIDALENLYGHLKEV